MPEVAASTLAGGIIFCLFALFTHLVEWNAIVSRYLSLKLRLEFVQGLLIPPQDL
jgi:hypothetical protein